MHIRLGTRGSELALWQANHTKALLENAGYTCELVIIKTTGDVITHLSFDKIEGKGFFTKEIEDALIANTIDLAVHSMKDLSTQSPSTLKIAGISIRQNAADWLLINKNGYSPGEDLFLKSKAIVGTSSARRKSQIQYFNPSVIIKELRGNVPTRIQKLRNGEYDAIVLAAAGIERLELDISDLEVIKFHPREFIPAPAQGVLAFQIRRDDVVMNEVVKYLHSADTLETVSVERKILQLMEGGCQMPLGVYCEKDKSGNFHVWTTFAHNLNSPLKRIQMSRSTNFQLAEDVVKELK
jgi:hydroxymethylbilane synthase